MQDKMIVENTDFIPPADPWELFAQWYMLAKTHEINDPDAMSVATVGTDGMPSLRMVLLKEYNADGMVFFTNRESRKGQQLKTHPKAALCLHWKSLRRQIRAEGFVREVSAKESDAYHATRPRGSQVGAWASQQSRPLSNRQALIQSAKDIDRKYEGEEVPRPPYWGGYRLVPLMIEFWQQRDFRLHDRIVYSRTSEIGPWVIERLYP